MTGPPTPTSHQGSPSSASHRRRPARPDDAPGRRSRSASGSGSSRDTPKDSAAQVVADVVVGDYRDLDDAARLRRGLRRDHLRPRARADRAPARPGGGRHRRAARARRAGARPGQGRDARAARRDRRARARARPHRRRPRRTSPPSPPRAAACRSSSRPPRGGYDGKGVWVVRRRRGRDGSTTPCRAASPCSPRRRSTSSASWPPTSPARPHGQAVAYPVVETVQVDGVCDEVIAPAPGLADGAVAEAQQLGADASPASSTSSAISRSSCSRPATAASWSTSSRCARTTPATGRWTARSPRSSSNHLRAVLDLPLGDPRATRRTVMVNVLGGDYPRHVPRAILHCMARDPGAKIHMYGKDVKPGRKVGHVTTLRRRPRRRARARPPRGRLPERDDRRVRTTR